MFEGYLRNTKLNLFDMEENLAGWARRYGDASVQTITEARDLDILLDTTKSYKFIFNVEGQLIIGSISKKVNSKMLSHPVLASREGGSRVISAGYMYRYRNTVYLVNHSGHYRPSVGRLLPVSGFIRNNFGFNTEIVQAETFKHGILKFFR
ncbi:hypothetical protein BB987_17625 [Photorhabdus temperata]|uniref:Uncharacterized protein n=2 Tax=Photorhabdus khanii TaxID=1004150 RepID=W3V7D4_9GAMM|nr:hypothetical protein [Photorhabdus khanii]ETS31718.1 hypothetical protein PTE_02408 [Photorhabdus khanii NC19]MQL49084.1 hypothetical protein [Photorhabdus khanii]OHV51059.1 hypothetical protein BB987_17625 [Photorhabdus temperata]